MDVVYPYKRRHDEFELRYSLRSVAAYLAHDRLIIAGDKPVIASKAVVLVQELPHLDRFKSSTNNIVAAVEKAGVEGEFVVMNDDFFLLRKWKYRLQHRGTIEEYIRRVRPRGPYREMAERTQELLRACGIVEPLFFGLHKPMVYDRQLLLEVLAEFRGESFLLRTLYGNLAPGRAVRSDDVKVWKWAGPPAGSCFSTADRCALDPEFRAWMRGRFPEPSIYEKPLQSALAHREAA